MFRRITTGAVAATAAVGIAVTAAPSAHADSTFIENSPYSRANIVVSDWCGGTPWRLGTNRSTLYPNGISYTKDDGAYIPGGRYFTVWRNGAKVYNNVYSGTGRTICFSPGAVMVLVV